VTTTTSTTTTTPSPYAPGDGPWPCSVGPGNTLYAGGYKAGLDDIRFNFENDNSTLDWPMYLFWGLSAQYLDQAKRDILGYPLVTASLTGGYYLARATPMAALPFLQLTTGRPYLFATQMSGTGWGAPQNGQTYNPALCFPIYQYAKVSVHFEALTYDIFTDLEMVQLGLVDGNGNPDEATLARYVTKEVMPGMEYLTLPQGGFKFVNTGNQPVAGTAGKLTPNYDISLIWELVPQSCIGTVLYNSGLQNPPIDNCLGCCNNTPFPAVPTATQEALTAATVSAAGNGYLVGDILFLLGGLTGVAASVQVATVGGAGAVATVAIIQGGNYTVNGGIPSPPSNPVSTATTGAGFGCTLTCTFTVVTGQQLMTAYPLESGTGYAIGDTFVLTGGTFTAAASGIVVALGSGTGTGPVLAVEITQRGLYQSPPANPVSTTTSGAGSGLVLNCEFGNGIPPGQLLMTGASITPIRSSAGDRLYRLPYRFKYLPQGVQKLFYQGTANFSSGNSVTVTGITSATNPTITTASAHGFVIGNTIVLAGNDPGPNGVFQVASVPTGTTFTINAPAPAAFVSGGTAGLSGAYQDAGYFEVTTNGFTNIGLNLYNSNPTKPPANIYPWADFNTLFRVPS
jgi:hypothetical protein